MATSGTDGSVAERLCESSVARPAHTHASHQLRNVACVTVVLSGGLANFSLSPLLLEFTFVHLCPLFRLLHDQWEKVGESHTNNAYAHARAPHPPSPCAHVISFFFNARNGQSSRSVVLRSLNYRRTRVAQPTKGGRNPASAHNRPARGGNIPKCRLKDRFSAFAAGQWGGLLHQSRECSEQCAVPTRRRHRRAGGDDIQRRAERAEALVQLGELSSGRHALEGASLAPGTYATLRELSGSEQATSSAT